VTTEDRIDNVLHRAVDESRDHRAHRWIGVGVGLLAAGLLALAVIIAAGYSTIEDLGARADSNAEVAQQLAEQVRDLGGVPAVTPPVPGERGEPGPPGPVGPAGDDGRDGVDGVTPPCLAEPGQCNGADGEPGPPGPPGPPGADGTDGTDGVDGQPGRDGAPGQDGVDGQPPAAWTWVDDRGRTQSCTRDAGSPDAAPTYTCTAPSDGPPGSAINPLPLGR
jgi:hypothetical protein